MNKLYGNAVVGQSGGPTAAINATLAGVIRGVKNGNFHNGTIGKLYGMRNGIEGMIREELVDLTERFESDDEIELLENTPAAALGSCRKKLPLCDDDPKFYENLVSIFKKYDIRYFFYIGGNDSMDTVAKLSEYTKKCDYEMRIIGIPKTIDNDLVVTDHTPGFGSAAKYIATTLQEIICDCAVYTTKAVTIVEIMGRDAGWLTAASAIGRVVNGTAPDLVYLPERIFSLEKFLIDVKNELENHPNVVVAVSEGLRFADGSYVGAGTQSGAVDIFGHKYLAGTGKALETAVKKEIGCKVRSVELNISQRCAAHLASNTDICEAVSVGMEAVRAAADGATCVMMTILREKGEKYRTRIGTGYVSEIANKIKYVDDKFINEQGNNVTDECCKYLLPLIVGERNIKFENGLPKHVVI